MCVPNDKFDSYTSRSAPTAVLLSTHGQIFIRLFVQVKCPTVYVYAFLDPILLIRFKNAAAAVRKLVSLTLDSRQC